MNFTLRKPCKQCPFRTDIETNYGWLGGDRALEIAHSLSHSVFPCHKTTRDDGEDGERSHSENACYGALVFAKKIDYFYTNFVINFAVMSQMLKDPESYRENLPIVSSIQEFSEMHDFSGRTAVKALIKFMPDAKKHALVQTYTAQLNN